MSIPPLVCSTPPPPDQCEEDKDPDDFDIPYNLSQDDDDEDAYGYGDFSYNHYQSNCISQEKGISEKKSVISNQENQQVDVTHNDPIQDNDKNESVLGTKTNKENQPKADEETNIEDLGLEVNEESNSLSEKEDDKSEGENLHVEHAEKAVDVISEATDEINTLSSPLSEENVVETESLDHSKENLDVHQTLDLDIQSIDTDITTYNNKSKIHVVTEVSSAPTDDTNIHDDFEDFDDFQFVSQERKASEIFENCDNPWETNEANDNDDFGNFTANFETVEKQNLPMNNENTDSIQIDSRSNPIDEEDDFGDFDDFKSSAADDEITEEAENSSLDQNMPVLNFHASDSEHQVLESITKVLTSIFEVEISEPDNEFEGKLEMMLSETWGHLRETDVRQPYIINWNNSLGQKTLLRALCIDSRNILFGPKWSYNMPKYAVNLSSAPLQPQKPSAPSISSQSEVVTAEKPTVKPGGWTDPFIADGQESCNTESEPVVEVTPTDLDVFEAAITNKSDKIYSSTLNVQPLRQISLPDTHIFTPTDSETPTSKTVHYDNGPSVILPKTLESGEKAELSTANSSSIDSKDDDDYWEFQDFKSSSIKVPTTSAPPANLAEPPPETKLENIVKPNVTYQTQVLEPIKMEPLIPTVNWPDPGEIKETFDDFSDFVSNSTWSDKPQEQTSTSTSKSANITPTESSDLDKINDKHKNVEPEKEMPKLNNDDFDDDFDTFQSVLPQKHIATDFNFDGPGTSVFNNIPSQNSNQIQDFNAFPKISNVKSETISGNNLTKPIETLTQSLSSTPESVPNKNSFSLGNSMSSNFLQPIPTTLNVTTSQNKQKSSQILQPLSLESYSQINWPNPGIDLQDLSRFNPVETLQSLKSDLSVGGPSKVVTPVHNQKTLVNNQVADDDIWGEFVSSKPKQQTLPKKPASFVDDDEWTDFVSSPSVKPQNGLNTISLNVHTNSNIQKSSNLNKFPAKNNQLPLDIPTLNYITPKASGHNSYNDRHFQNL